MQLLNQNPPLYWLAQLVGCKSLSLSVVVNAIPFWFNMMSLESPEVSGQVDGVFIRFCSPIWTRHIQLKTICQSWWTFQCGDLPAMISSVDTPCPNPTKSCRWVFQTQTWTWTTPDWNSWGRSFAAWQSSCWPMWPDWVVEMLESSSWPSGSWQCNLRPISDTTAVNKSSTYSVYGGSMFHSVMRWQALTLRYVYNKLLTSQAILTWLHQLYSITENVKYVFC